MSPMNHYQALTDRLACGWNTWNTRSVLSHVLLPAGLALNLAVKNYAGARDLWSLQVDKDNAARPGPHAWDGSYTHLTVHVPGGNPLTLTVESAHDGPDLVLLVTPAPNTHVRTPLLLCEAGFLWNRPGHVTSAGDTLTAHTPDGPLPIHATTAPVTEPNTPFLSPYLALPLQGPVGLSTGRPRTLADIQAVIARQKQAHAARAAAWGDLADVYDCIQSCMAWDTIYDPQNHRVISPVSRIWNCNRGGWALFCWDTYFGALLCSVDHKDLAYANAIAITKEHVEPQYAGGLLFVPNVAQATGRKHRDHSQPPVGSLTVELLHARFGDRWLPELLFDDLLAWNRWWDQHRRHDDLLCWGSNPYAPVVGEENEKIQNNTWLGAIMESGLDNSPMYDNVPFNDQTHLMALHDVGLNALYVADCASLARLADVLNRPEAAELRARQHRTAAALQTLWDASAGIFLNRRTDTGAPNPRTSPTNLYPFFEHVATDEQAARMLADHMMNPARFNTPCPLPATPADDPAYQDQDYWRGRVWAPMNFLVYLGLRHYTTPAATAARRHLVERSTALLLHEWRQHGHVHENYHPETAAGCDVHNSDPFYHWGALLGLMAIMERYWPANNQQ